LPWRAQYRTTIPHLPTGPNPEAFLVAVADVAKARGMTQLAHDTGLGRESLYKALAPGAKPRYDTVLKLLHGLGMKLTVTPLHG